MSAPLSAQNHYRLHGVTNCNNTRSQCCGVQAILDGWGRSTFSASATHFLWSTKLRLWNRANDSRVL